MRLLLSCAVLFFASRGANAACVISGARPTVPLPTMEIGQEFSFVASPDCETLRFTIGDTTVSRIPKSGGPVGPGPGTYRVVLTESEWDAVVAESGSTLTWVVTGRTSAGVMTRMVTTNELKGHPIQFDLSMADAKLIGDKANDRISGSVAGDVNGDGNDDLFLSAPTNSDGGFHVGAGYLVLGPVSGTLDLSLADAKLVGEEPGDGAYAAGGAGDVDGDGNDDLLMASWPNESSTGAVYLVHGPVRRTLDLSLADAKLVGETFDDDDYPVCSVSGAGDVNGDGHDDVLVGTCGKGDPYGIAYLVNGPITGTFDLGLSDAKLMLEPSYLVSTNVSAAGDMDGDGIDDVLIGAPGDDEADTFAGAAYLVRGPVSGVVDLSLGHTKLLGELFYEGVGSSVSGAGDIDGDGNDDVLITSPSRDEGGAYSGVVYVVLGPGPAPGDWDLESVADAKLRSADQTAVYVVAGAGDVDLDGHDDILVDEAGRGTSPDPHAGVAYLVRGPVSGTMDLTRADIQFNGERTIDNRAYPGDGGDVDGDGRSDVLINVPVNDDGGENAGAAYLIYGGGL